jgi:hypothetical protein
MAQKHGRKIRRSKNLYKPRKSRARKLIEIGAMAVVLCCLVILGWGIGSAILNYSPPVGDDSVIPTDNIADPTDPDQPQPDEPDPPPEPITGFNAIAAPSSVLDNSTSLAAYIQQAKNNGFNAVLLEIKDSTGYLYYASEYEQIQGSDIIRGTLSAEQIFAAFEDTGVRPVVRLNTLLDRLAPAIIEDVSYVFTGGGGWLDDRLENDGKRWANPFLQGTRDYHLFIIDELMNAGFADIILANAIFPHFRTYDRSVLEPEFTAPATRFEGLVGFVKALENKGATLYLEMTVKDVVENYAGFNNTAELLRGKKDLAGFELILVYNKDDFGSEYKTGEHSTVVLPANDMGALINLLLRQAANQTELNIVPFLNRENLTDREISDILLAFGGLGYESFVIR